MDQATFRRVVEEDLAPMLAGVLSADSRVSTAREKTVAYDTICRLLVKPSRSADYRLAVDRSQKYSEQEKLLAEQFLNELETITGLNAGTYETDLLRAVPTRVIAQHMRGGEVLRDVLDHLQTWSSQTYEGQRIVAAVGIQSADGDPDVPLQSLWDEDYGPVMTNGFDTLLEIDREGNVRGLAQLDVPGTSRTAPYRLGRVAQWTQNGNIAVVLNRNGEVLVFRDASLHFARRNGRWVHYSHEANVPRLSPPLDFDLRSAIYESCLDVSYARCGGCVGVLSWSNSGKTQDLIDDRDLLASSLEYKAEFVRAAIAGRRFHKLDRRVRQELLALDGALVLDHTGVVLAAGAIIDVPAGSKGGGGRRAAAVRLSSRGLGVKVSQDGSIVGFHNGVMVLTT